MIRKIVTPIIIAISAFCMGATIHVIMKKRGKNDRAGFDFNG
jgi:hypothetical protein